MGHNFIVTRSIWNLRVRATLDNLGVAYWAKRSGEHMKVRTEGTTSYQCTAINRAIDGQR